MSCWELDPLDVKVERYRKTGKGGYQVVTCTYLPTGKKCSRRIDGDTTNAAFYQLREECFRDLQNVLK